MSNRAFAMRMRTPYLVIVSWLGLYALYYWNSGFETHTKTHSLLPHSSYHQIPLFRVNSLFITSQWYYFEYVNIFCVLTMKRSVAEQPLIKHCSLKHSPITFREIPKSKWHNHNLHAFMLGLQCSYLFIVISEVIITTSLVQELVKGHINT